MLTSKTRNLDSQDTDKKNAVIEISVLQRFIELELLFIMHVLEALYP